MKHLDLAFSLGRSAALVASCSPPERSLAVNVWAETYTPLNAQESFWGQELLLSICVREEGGEGPGDCQAVVLETRGHRWPLTWGLMERYKKTPLSAVDKGVCWRKCQSGPDNRETMGLQPLAGVRAAAIPLI